MRLDHRQARRAALWATGLAATGAAQAHPGHDSAPSMGFIDGLMHLLTQPDHLWILAGAVALGVMAARGWRQRGGPRLPQR